VAAQELQTAFADIISHEDTLKEKSWAKFNLIVGAKNKCRFLKGLSTLTIGAREMIGALAEVQTEILDQVTDVELESWGVTREVAEVAMRKLELEVLGGIYKSSVRKRRNNIETIEKYWEPGWVEEFGQFCRPWLSVEFTRQCAKASGD